MSQTLADQLGLRRLGRTGLYVPALSLGGAGIGRAFASGRPEEAMKTVHYALSQGIRYIDTAAGYGESETAIGLALEGVPRETVILSTKTGSHPGRRGDYSWDGTLWSVENSLRRLKTSYIDLLMVHDPAVMEPVLAPRGAVEALEELKRQGVIRHIGLGQRSHAFHRQVIESGRFEVILTYNDYHPVRTTAADWLLPLAAKYDVGVLNGAALAHGLLTGEDPDEVCRQQRISPSETDMERIRRLYRWCRDQKVPLQAVAFQFCLRQPLIHCTLTGARSREELEENLEAATYPLPEGLWEELEGVMG
ncbi:MAG: aldo/keto reductase [Armatimonadota bacterium]|nr:aldo/keto reductase [Armatimonadota bacterium]